MTKIVRQTTEVPCHCVFVVKLVGRDLQNLVVATAQPSPNRPVLLGCHWVPVDVFTHAVEIDAHTLAEIVFRISVDDVGSRGPEGTT